MQLNYLNKYVWRIVATGDWDVSNVGTTIVITAITNATISPIGTIIKYNWIITIITAIIIIDTAIIVGIYIQH